MKMLSFVAVTVVMVVGMGTEVECFWDSGFSDNFGGFGGFGGFGDFGGFGGHHFGAPHFGAPPPPPPPQYEAPPPPPQYEAPPPPPPQYEEPPPQQQYEAPPPPPQNEAPPQQQYEAPPPPPPEYVAPPPEPPSPPALPACGESCCKSTCHAPMSCDAGGTACSDGSQTFSRGPKCVDRDDPSCSGCTPGCKPCTSTASFCPPSPFTPPPPPPPCPESCCRTTCRGAMTCDAAGTWCTDGKTTFSKSPGCLDLSDPSCRPGVCSTNCPACPKEGVFCPPSPFAGPPPPPPCPESCCRTTCRGQMRCDAAGSLCTDGTTSFSKSPGCLDLGDPSCRPNVCSATNCEMCPREGVFCPPSPFSGGGGGQPPPQGLPPCAPTCCKTTCRGALKCDAGGTYCTDGTTTTALQAPCLNLMEPSCRPNVCAPNCEMCPREGAFCPPP